MRTAKELRRAARDDLKGKWHIGIIITLICAVIGVYSVGPLPNVSVPMEEWIKNPALLTNWSELFYFDIRTVRSGLFYLLGAAGVLGQCYCYKLLADKQPCKILDVFHCYPQIASAIGLRLLRTLYTFLGLTVFVLPGLYLHYTYAQAPWIMMEHPSTGVRAALAESRRMMKGSRWRMAKLDLSFAPWFVLSLASFGIGLLFFAPYHKAAMAEFYNELRRQEA